jgi:hypothetical protein
MRKLILTAVAFAACLSVYGQGTVNDRGTVNFANIGSPTTDRVTYLGANWGGGSTIQFGLYAGADGATETELVQVGAGGTGLTGGLYNLGARTIVNLAADGGFAMVQVRAWEVAFGTDYASVIANPAAAGVGRVGASNLTRVDTGNPDALPTPELPANLVSAGVHGFALTPVPEPSVIGLGILGAMSLFLLRRRK